MLNYHVVSGVVIHGKQTKIPELNGDLWENHQTRWLIFQPAPRLMIAGGFFLSDIHQHNKNTTKKHLVGGFNMFLPS